MSQKSIHKLLTSCRSILITVVCILYQKILILYEHSLFCDTNNVLAILQERGLKLQ